eukprot:12038829-Alexandrium_andersonii.AAC.1
MQDPPASDESPTFCYDSHVLVLAWWSSRTSHIFGGLWMGPPQVRGACGARGSFSAPSASVWSLARARVA